MGKASLKKKSKFFLISILPQHQSPESASIKIPPFRPKFTIVKIPLNVNIVKQEVWKGEFQFLLILCLISMYFDAVAVKKNLFLF